MSNETKEQLSALMDGELERDQARFLIRRIGSDAELTACWQRWHLGSDSMRGAASAPLRSDFAAQVAAAIAADATPALQRGWPLLRWAGGAALAASVALAALLVVQPSESPVGSGDAIVAADPVQTGPVAEVAPSPYRERDLRPPLPDARAVSRPVGDAPFATSVRIDPRVEAYLVRHNEATAAQGLGFVSYVPLVTPLRERAPVVTEDAH